MIYVLLGLAVLYGCIMTGLFLAMYSAAQTHRANTRIWFDACQNERDRNQASSLSEYTANKRMAMPIPDDQPNVIYGWDDTGIVRGIISTDE